MPFDNEDARMMNGSSQPRIRAARNRPQPLVAASGTIADRVAAILVDHIRRHRLSAGTPLPSEMQTSSELRVSRGVVREAYRSLSSAGLVEIANGRSPRVGYLSNRSLLRVVQHALWTEQASAEQILELRAPIEERAAELAAANRTALDVDGMRRAVTAMEMAGTAAEAYVSADIQFHEILGRATGNPLFGLVSSALREAMGASIRAGLAGRRSRADHLRVVRVHSRIVDAIEQRKPREAKRLMQKHFADAYAAVRRQPSPRNWTLASPAKTRGAKKR